MSTKTAITLLAAAIALGSMACSKEKKKTEAPKAECKLVGDWTIEANEGVPDNKQISADLTFDGSSDTIASGTATMGTNKGLKAMISGSAADAKSVEGGKTANVNFTIMIGDNSPSEKKCKLMFTDECGSLTLDCGDQKHKAMRAK